MSDISEMARAWFDWSRSSMVEQRFDVVLCHKLDRVYKVDRVNKPFDG
jgi:hypothetical protein